MEYIFCFYNGNLLSLHTVDNFHRAHPIHPYNHLCHRKTTIREYICNLHGRGIYANLKTKNKNSWNHIMLKKFLSFSKNLVKLSSVTLVYYSFTSFLYCKYQPVVQFLFLQMWAGSSLSSPQSLSKSHFHKTGMHLPLLQENSVSGSHARLSEMKMSSWLKIEKKSYFKNRGRKINMIEKTDKSKIYMLKCWRVVIDFFLFWIKIENNFHYDYSIFLRPNK